MKNDRDKDILGSFLYDHDFHSLCVGKIYKTDRTDRCSKARNFYFVSDLLDGGMHRVTVKEDVMASVTLTLMNYMDEERYSEVDIDYVVEVRDTDKDEKSSLTVSPAAGTITKGQRNAVEIVVSGLKAGHTYKITASTDNTYAKTLTGVVKVNADDSPLCAPEADGKVQSEAEFTDRSFLKLRREYSGIWRRSRAGGG